MEHTEATLATRPTWLRRRRPRPSRALTPLVDRRPQRTRITRLRRPLVRLRPTALLLRDTRLSRTAGTLRVATADPATRTPAIPVRVILGTAVRFLTATTLDGKTAVTPAPTPETLAQLILGLTRELIPALLTLVLIPALLIPALLIPAPTLELSTLAPTPARSTPAPTRVL